MVAVTRSKIKRPDVSSIGVSSSRVKDTTPGSPARVEIPKVLYDVITDAASIRGSLRTNKNDKGLRRNLYAKERRIKLLAIYYKSTRELPSSWEYNHKTAIFTHVPKPLKPPKKKIKRKIVRLPTINGTLLNEEEQKVWMKFETMNKKVKAHEFISFPMKKIQVAVTDPVVDFILGFAVEAFNDFYHKYVKEHGSKNITQAVPVECKYYKLTSEYLFYVTIDAIEQGKPGVYEAAVECDRVTGARTLTSSYESYNKVETRRDPTTRTRYRFSLFPVDVSCGIGIPLAKHVL
ncbi:hypothetical protein Tco_1083748 [Tanacetum coccineum]